MSQQTYTEHVSNALAAYRAYRQQDPAERRIGTYIDILDSLFPPLSSTHGADDLLLTSLLMFDPNMLGCTHPHTQVNAPLDAHTQPDTQEFREGLQPHMAPSQAASHLTPGHPNQAELTHAVSDMNHVPGSMQQFRVAGDPNNPVIYYNSSYGYHGPYMHSGFVDEQIPAPRVLKFEPTAATTPLLPAPGPQVSGDPRPRPRPRPRPISSFSSALVLEPALAHVPMSTSHNHSATTTVTTKGKGRAHSTTPCPPTRAVGPTSGTTGPFVGHGLMSPVRFNQKRSGSSGLQIMPSSTPNYSIRPLSFIPAKPEPEPAYYHNHYHAYGPPTSALKAFKSSGRVSSPIDLCSSSDKADEDDVEIVVPAKLPDVPEEWEGDDEVYGGEESDDGEIADELEGVEEAHQRAASERATSVRSSSPPDIDDLREMIKKGGKPVMEPEELREFLLAGRRNKLWFMVEKGLIIEHIYHPDVPEERSRKALQPINPRRPGKMWTVMSEDLFLSARVASAIAQQSNKILLVYKDIKYMIETRGFCVDLTLSKERAVRAIEAALVEAHANGAPLTTITTAPEVYYWINQGWYEMVDARVGNHPNFRTVTHRSGRVSPRQDTSSGASKKGKEKRAREDNPLSPQPREIVRPRPNDKSDSNTTHSSFSQPVDSPYATRSQARNAVAGPSTAVHDPSVPLADIPVDINSDAKPDVPTTTSNACDTNGFANALLKTCESAREFKDQLLEMRKVQLNIDVKNVDNKYKLGCDEQAGMEQERIHRIQLEQERAEREAAEMEERVNRAREGQLFTEMMHTLSHPVNVEPDILSMVNQHLRQKFLQGLVSQQPFVAPRNSIRHGSQSILTRRATSVSAPGPALTVTTHTNQAPVNYPTAATVNPPDSTLPARSTLDPSNQLPSLQSPAIPASASTSQPNEVVLSPVVAPTSDPSTKPATPPSDSAPAACGPSTSSDTVPYISATLRALTTATAPLGLSNCIPLPGSGTAMSLLSARTGSMSDSPDRSLGNTTPGLSTVTRSHTRHVTAPATSHTVNNPVTVDQAFPQATSPSRSHAITAPNLSCASPPTSSLVTTPRHDRTSRVGRLDLGHSISSHSGLVNVNSVHLASSSRINDVSLHIASLQHQGTDYMALDQHEISPTGDEFVHINNEPWHANMGPAA